MKKATPKSSPYRLDNDKSNRTQSIHLTLVSDSKECDALDRTLTFLEEAILLALLPPSPVGIPQEQKLDCSCNLGMHLVNIAPAIEQLKLKGHSIVETLSHSRHKTFHWYHMPESFKHKEGK